MLVCVLLAACLAGGDTDSSFAVWNDTVRNIPRVTSRGAPAHWTLERENRIGSLADAPDSFGRIRSVVLDSESNIFVADALGRRVVTFDSTGAYVRTIGRPGAGPGEFEQPYSLGWLGDTLLVLDPGNARIGKFSKTGQWWGIWRWQPLTGGQIYLKNGSIADVYAPFLHKPHAGGGIAYLHFAATGSADTMQTPEAPPEEPSGPVCRYPGNGGIEFFGIPFGPELHIAGGRDGTLLAGWSASYQIAQVSSRADTTRLIRRLRASVPIADSEWEARTRRYRNVTREYPGTVCEPDHQPRPPHKPAFRWFGLDSDGRLWVEVYSEGGFTFEVFDSAGTLVGAMPAPHRDPQVPPYIGRGRLATVARDSLHVHYVEVYSYRERQR
jgi:hypothetical protein